jgi:hypothetical protein
LDERFPISSEPRERLKPRLSWVREGKTFSLRGKIFLFSKEQEEWGSAEI